MDPGDVFRIAGVEGRLDEMLLEGGPTPFRIGMEFQKRFGQASVIQPLLRQDRFQDGRIFPFPDQGVQILSCCGDGRPQIGGKRHIASGRRQRLYALPRRRNPPAAKQRYHSRNIRLAAPEAGTNFMSRCVRRASSQAASRDGRSDSGMTTIPSPATHGRFRRTDGTPAGRAQAACRPLLS